MSAESGIPTFRGAEGYWTVGAREYHPQELATRAAFELMRANLRAHFAAEDEWMRETDFPARDCHIDEHAAVLRSADEVLPQALAIAEKLAPEVSSGRRVSFDFGQPTAIYT